MPSHALSFTSNSSISFVAIARSFAGGIMLLAPQIGGQFFGIPFAPEANVVARLFGIRDLTLGFLLRRFSLDFSSALSKSDTALANQSGRDLKRILFVGMIIDSVDVVSCLISAWNGEIAGKAMFWGPCGAGIFALLQCLARANLETGD
ncbi:hypothetical protein F1880_005563 [Penicillium rolfsii]|nr:hypothetical protein F1880_005563 [Penicillium rolfsii]